MDPAARRFRFGTEGADPARTLIVDGAASGFRSLSHWPGNSTPAALRHDLSTGMALALASRPADEQQALLGSFEVVVNNHYDTDGALSAFAVLRPAEALAQRALLLAAAATGDFATWHGEAALAVDLTITALPRHAASPLAGRWTSGAPDEQRFEDAYLWLLDALPGLLGDPFRHAPLWQSRHAAVVADVARVGAGSGLRVERLPALDLARIEADREFHAIALHHAAGALYRLLVSTPRDGGWIHRFCFRDESWFELVTARPAPRVPLDGAVAELQRLERMAQGGAPPATWWCGTLGDPVVQLGYGDPALAEAAGFFLDPLPGPAPASRLPPAVVADVLEEALTGPCREARQAAEPVPPDA